MVYSSVVTRRYNTWCRRHVMVHRIQNNQNQVQAAGRQSQSVNQQDGITNNYVSELTKMQDQLKGLAGNHDLSPDEKQSRQRELRQQIAELNRKIAKLQMERQKEQREKKTKEIITLVENEMPKPRETDETKERTVDDKAMFQEDEPEEKEVFDTAAIRDLITADSEKNLFVQENTIKMKLQSNKDVIESEIDLDTMRGQDITRKIKRIENIELRLDTLPYYKTKNQSK